jgi:hypothetical protein
MATKETRVFISGNNAGWRRSRDSATRQDSHHSPKTLMAPLIDSLKKFTEDFMEQDPVARVIAE